ncbi:hypothetical protein B0H16DRAFT_1737410 [Mycena metata]|uniref:Uncharacterized protein n=1 Tax=Mycena metata TaxID=1033252 RepID=A0AAD7HLY5_9AGAR|nr:hypothetical protein B0H16DRAFT_1737410 [Mycena metata]
MGTSEGGEVDVEMDEDEGGPNAIPDTDLDMHMGADDGEDDTDARAIAAALRDAGVDALGRVVIAGSAEPWGGDASAGSAFLKPVDPQPADSVENSKGPLACASNPAHDVNSTTDVGASAPGPTPAFPQPHLITGATLDPYQLEGLQWMLGLDEQGISGILGAFCVFLACV